MKINRDVPSPFAMQLEPVEGCNLACSFCGLQSIRNNGADAELGIHGKNSPPYKFMDMAIINKVAKESSELGWNPRFEFALHGEPTMHKELPAMVSTIRRHHPKGYIMITSNGGGLVKDTVGRISDLFKAGLNTLAIDDYEHSGGLMAKIKTQLGDDIIGGDWQTLQYPKQAEGNPHHRHPGRKLVFINDISENDKGTHQLTNQGGASFAAKTEPVAQRCAKPFRELSVRWDGNVAICCDDWPGKYKIGNVLELSLNEIWYHPRFEAARRKLYAADRDFGKGAPCTGCDVRTYRNGLLPDKLGRKEMLPLDAEAEREIRAALGGRVFSIKVAS